LEGTKNTPASEHSRYHQKFAELEGTKNNPQANICNIAKKSPSWRGQKYPPKQKFAIWPKIAELEGCNKFPKYDRIGEKSPTKRDGKTLQNYP
jgi:hypothetical protein